MIWTREVLARIQHENDEMIRSDDLGNYFGDSWNLMGSVINDMTLFVENFRDLKNCLSKFACEFIRFEGISWIVEQNVPTHLLHSLLLKNYNWDIPRRCQVKDKHSFCILLALPWNQRFSIFLEINENSSVLMGMLNIWWLRTMHNYSILSGK